MGRRSTTATSTFANANSPATTATFSAAGVYVLRLTGNDTDQSASDDVTITVKLAGDFNGDGKVNGQDFLIWQAHYPTTSGATTDIGDANGDGKVNGQDFLIWQAHYPTIGGANSDIGDANNDGKVNGQDFLVWQANYKPLQ